jgi:hypothetical protein
MYALRLLLDKSLSERDIEPEVTDFHRKVSKPFNFYFFNYHSIFTGSYFSWILIEWFVKKSHTDPNYLFDYSKYSVDSVGFVEGCYAC